MMMDRVGLEKNLRQFFPFNRRKDLRTLLHDKLYLDYRFSDGQEGGSAKGENLCARGICFACSTDLPKDASLDLTLRLSPCYFGVDKPVRVHVRVVHCERRPPHVHYRVGAQFDRPDGQTCHEIGAFLRWLRKDS